MVKYVGRIRNEERIPQEEEEKEEMIEKERLHIFKQ
jgi:hypothetical protein